MPLLMADSSKAEKLAAARKKLKEFQEKNREPNVNSARSTPPSQKSYSPIGSTNNIPAQAIADSFHSPAEADSTDHSLCLGNINKVTTPNENPEINGKPDVTNLFSFHYSNNNNNENFFDNLSQPTVITAEVPRVVPPPISNFPQAQQIPVEKSLSDSPKVNDLPPDTNGHQPSPTAPPLLVDEDSSALRIASLESRLSLERRNTEELQRKLSESHGHILSLQYEIKRLNDEQTKKTADEVVQLEEKLKFQLQTIEILVSEKSELQKDIFNLQEDLKTLNGKCEELSSRLKASRSQVQKLERDLSERSENKSQHDSILKKLEDELQQKDYVEQDALRQLTDSRNEMRELERRVEVGLNDQGELRRQLEERDRQLSMARLKLAQLGGESDENSLKEIESLKEQLMKSEKEAKDALEGKKKVEAELKEYIRSLNGQVLQANAKCERTEKDKEDLERRVEDLIHHLSELERQLQREKGSAGAGSRGAALPEGAAVAGEGELVEAFRQEIADLRLQLANKAGETDRLARRLSEVEDELAEAERLKSEVPDMRLLQAAMESDRLAATRALEQNTALKQKLTELEEYIMKINNKKLELTEELDRYKHMAGEYRLHLEKFKSRQEMRWVDSVTQTNHIRKSNADSQTTVEDVVQNIDPNEPVSVETLVMIEEKLKRTMDRLADLSDEKQRLEHLVLHLQSETETIGEYVTLYQNQRSLLREKADEKERQVQLIAEERGQLRAKLDQINSLLSRFPHNPDVEDTTCKISSLLGEIQSSSLVQDRTPGLAPPSPPSTFHPCLLCSGKLITV